MKIGAIKIILGIVFGLLLIISFISSAEVKAAAVSVSPVFTSNMQIGSSLADVKRLQQILNSDPDTQIAVSGLGSPERESNYFGSATEKAVQKFQIKYGVVKKGESGYGIVGAKTRAKIQEVFYQNIPLEISGWIPYWRKATGTAEALKHIDTFKEINPFGYTIKNDGTLFDAMKIDEEPWPELIKTAEAKKVRVIPTVMWSNGAIIHKILSNTKTRIKLEDDITALVKKNNFDGIDIDFEGKYAKTRPYFSTFLKGLYQRMGKKWVMCTIEARTPLDSRYDTIPKDIEYANDFVAINKYCDRVRIMAYDQGSIDLRLNKSVPGTYVPVADTKWVEKVVRLTMKTIPKNKIAIGVATYGYEYEFTPLKEDGYRYDLLWAFNPKYALELSQQLKIAPERNIAGEQSFIYHPSALTTSTQNATDTLDNNIVPPENSSQMSSSVIFSQNFASTNTPMRILWWSDAKAIKEKVDLAKKLGTRGIAIFKIDGGADPAIWNILY